MKMIPVLSVCIPTCSYAVLVIWNLSGFHVRFFIFLKSYTFIVSGEQPAADRSVQLNTKGDNGVVII